MGRVITLIVALLFCGAAIGQGVRLKGNIAGFGGAHFVGVPPGYTKLNVRYEFVAMLVDSGLHVPQYNGTPSGVRTGVWVGDGAVAVDTLNGYFYWYSGGAWIKGAKYSDVPAAYTAGDGLLLTGTEFKVLTKRSITIDNDSIMLVNDSTASPVSYFYGTNVAGRKGWYAQSSIVGADTISTTLIAYVDSLGSDVTGTVGNPAKPYATINAALLATASATKRVIKVGLGTFASPTHAAYIKANTEIIGSGKPTFNNTSTGGPYPFVVSTTPTKLVGGTILQGTFEAPNVSNIQVRDIGVDVGSAFIGGGAAQEGFIFWADTSGTPGTHTNQNGKVFRNNVILDNIIVLQKDSTSLVHTFDIENCFRPVISNITTWGGFAGVVSKNVGAQMSNIFVNSVHANYYGIIIKCNTYAYSYNTLLDGFYINRGAGVTLHSENDGPMENITVTNGYLFQPQYGVSTIGDTITGLNISNITVSNATALSFSLLKLKNSIIHDNIVFASSDKAFYVTGNNVIVSDNSSANGFDYDYDLTGSGSCQPVLAYNNVGLSDGFLYNGFVYGSGNYGSAVTGTIYMPTEVCANSPVTTGIYTLQKDTITLATFGAGARFVTDTSAFTDSTMYGAFYNSTSDTLVVTSIYAVMNGGTSDTLGVQLYYNDTINVIGSAIATATLPVNSTTTGNSTTTLSNPKIPPGNWVWCKTPSVVVGRRPYFLSVSMIGYKSRRL